ncbi:MAG: hypothetical protein ABR970_11750 [Roseiarcus sp.]
MRGLKRGRGGAAPAIARGRLLAMAGAAALAAAVLLGGAARAAPATLANDADVTAFARRVKDYAKASRVRWVVAARTHADAEAVIATIGLHLRELDLGKDEVQRLTNRIAAQSFRDSPETTPDASIPVAWMAPQTGQIDDGPRCSWQVWVKDPNVPSVAAGGVSVPLAPNDRLPVSPDATFRVGYAGLLQSRLYAFDETQPGAIRDLAAAPDVNIPVAAGPGADTILLAMARQPAPIYEEIRARLAASAGQRRELGKEFALRNLGLTRNIGANLQLFNSDRVVAKEDSAAAARREPAVRAADGQSGELMETCLFSLTPTAASAQ